MHTVVDRLCELTGMVVAAYSWAGSFGASVAAVRVRLDEEAFATAWARDEAMSMEEAVVYALEGLWIGMIIVPLSVIAFLDRPAK